MNATCLKLLQHCDNPITSMTWILTFNGIATFDGQCIRVYLLKQLDSIEEEILVPQQIWNIKKKSKKEDAISKIYYFPHQLVSLHVSDHAEEHTICVSMLDFK